jgi:DNA-binding beta-propeller fold protein YncE
MKRTIISVIQLSACLAYGQDYALSGKFGEFRNATAFSVSTSSVYYVIDADESVIYKIDGEGKSLQQAGGFGWENGLFDEPVDVFATPLKVLVTDKNNHRVQQFDKNLILTGVLNSAAIDGAASFKYPAGCIYSEAGDIFLLDGFNKRVLKFDVFGKFVQEFGTLNWGDFSLREPRKIKLLDGNTIAVLDHDRIVFYDQYGNGVGQINSDKPIADFIRMKDGIYILAENTVQKLSTGDQDNNTLKTIFSPTEKASALCRQGEDILLLSVHTIYRLSH